MELENVECQLAQAQMSRYIAGDNLPEDTIKQLEKHISTCPSCQESATEKKISLEEMLRESREETAKPAEISPEPAPVATPQPAPIATTPDKPADDIDKILNELVTSDEADALPPNTYPEPSLSVDSFELSDEDIAAAFESASAPVTTPFEQPVEEVPLAVTEPTPAPAPTPVAVPTPVAKEVEENPEPKPKKSFKLPQFGALIPSLKSWMAQNAKPLVIGMALGMVLLSMGAFIRNPKRMLGSKVVESTSKKSEETATETKTKEHASKPTEKKASKPKTPIKTVKPTPKKTEKPIAKPLAKPAAKPATHTEASEYEIADSKGNIVTKGAQKPANTPPNPKPKTAAAVTKHTPAKPATAKPKLETNTHRRHKSRVYRASKSKHAPKSQAPPNLKKGQGFVKVYQ